MNETVEYSNMSLFFDIVMRVAGDAGAQAIREARGGTEITVPRSVTPQHWLAILLGYKTALSLCHQLRVIDADNNVVGDFVVYIPQGEINRHKRSHRELRENIRQGFLAGETVNAMAMRLGVSARTIKRHRVMLFGRAKGGNSSGHFS